MIKVVGVGAAKGDITERGARTIKEADKLYSRTKLWFDTEVLSERFSFAAGYAELDEAIIAALVEADERGEKAVYCALGDGFTDTAVKGLCERVSVEFVAGVSEYRGRTAESGLVLVSAYDLLREYDTTRPLLVYGIDDRLVAGNVKLALSGAYGDETEVVFSSGKEQVTVPLYEIDRMRAYSSAAVYIRGNRDLMQKKRYCFTDLIDIMDRLTAPDGCPWDRAQTHESIRINLIEEAYEAADAIDSKDTDNLREEIGDVLLQAVFHCNIAERTGEFTFGDVVDELARKLVFRHTHIFGKNKATDPDSALAFWEKAKAEEKHYSSLCEQLTRLPDAFPALLYAAKVCKKTVKAGALADKEKLQSRLIELIERGINESNAADMLLLCSFISALSGVDAEAELSRRAREFASAAAKADESGALARLEELL